MKSSPSGRREEEVRRRRRRGTEKKRSLPLNEGAGGGGGIEQAGLLIESGLAGVLRWAIQGGGGAEERWLISHNIKAFNKINQLCYLSTYLLILIEK